MTNVLHRNSKRGIIRFVFVFAFFNKFVLTFFFPANIIHNTISFILLAHDAYLQFVCVTHTLLSII